MRIVLVADGLHPFTGEDFHLRAVGGTQAAIVCLAEGLAGLGHDVAVVTAAAEPSDCRGVRYTPREALADPSADLLVLVREWTPAVRGIAAPRRIFVHMNVAPVTPENMHAAVRWADHLVLASPYQRGRVEKEHADALGDVPRTVVDLAICADDYPDLDGDRPNRLVYCSVPDRGLEHLRRTFPEIRKAVPDAELVITSDFTLWGLRSRRGDWERGFARMDGVLYAGAVDRPELVEIQRSSKVMAFPCHFEEAFCIAAAECMAAGAVPVTTDDYALSTTVGDAGVLIPGPPRSRAYRKAFVAAVVELLTDDAAWRRRAGAAREAALARYAPAVVATRFLEAAGA